MIKPDIILTKDLTLKDVPPQTAKLQILNRFALTFDPREITDFSKIVVSLDEVSQMTTLIGLRSILYTEQRRWNHYGDTPDIQTEKKIRQVVAWIRQKLTPDEITQ